MSSFSFHLPHDFPEYESEVVSKGWFSGARLTVSGKQYHLRFFEPVRLAQEIEDELKRGGVFFEPNLMIIESVTRKNMERAVALLMTSGRVVELVES
jgi:hypothetical protein